MHRHPDRPRRPRFRRALGGVAFAVDVPLAACGGSGGSPAGVDDRARTSVPSSAPVERCRAPRVRGAVGPRRARRPPGGAGAGGAVVEGPGGRLATGDQATVPDGLPDGLPLPAAGDLVSTMTIGGATTLGYRLGPDWRDRVEAYAERLVRAGYRETFRFEGGTALTRAYGNPRASVAVDARPDAHGGGFLSVTVAGPARG